MSAKKQTPRKPARPRSDFQRLSRRFMSGLLRSLFFINAFPRYKRAGFVLPTTVLLLLVMTLTVGALSFRTASRTQSTFLAREQQVIDNVAAPAADRAKSKLEYLFGKDSRFPGSSTPSSDTLAALLGDVTNTALGVTKLDTDPYTFPGETRIDINNDGNLDNAWSFNFDLNGDGTQDKDEIVAYSILMDDAVDNNSPPTPGDRSDDIKIEDELSQTKANALVTRNGPINTDESLSSCGTSREPDQGWFQVNTGEVEKNFQVTTFVSNGKKTGRANSAFELQQVRRARKGNSWGAWFKYDIDVTPGPDLLWNGAMHSDGSLFANKGFQGLMISSHNSCLYTKESSAITLAEIDYNGDKIIDPAAGDFQGQLVVGSPGQGEIKKKSGNDSNPDIHIFNQPGTAPKKNQDNKTKLTIDNDSVLPSTGNDNGNDNKNVKPADISLDPFTLFTRNISQHRDTSSWQRDKVHAGNNKPSWENNAYRTGERVINRNQRPPYLDDFYRADGRYGPRPSYGTVNWVEDSDDGPGGSTSNDKKLGALILNSDPKGDSLINETAGLDGYWERQAKTHGTRIVVGQRLELGNSFGWQGNNDSLYAPNVHGVSNKQLQRRTLRDNLAAVQGMVVYHYESGEPDGAGGTKNLGGYPLACVASTVHPGTFETLVASRNFQKEVFKDSSNNNVDLISNFFSGKGTNGWEYDFPTSFKATKTGTGESFGSALGKSKPLGIALRNLANFAGDPNGGSPSFTPVQDSDVHPYQAMSMWGDYSILRRIFNDFLDNTSGWNSTLTNMSDRYDELSPADKSSLHSSACTLGLLSSSITTLNKVDIEKSVDAGTFTSVSNQGQVKNKVGGPVWDEFVNTFVSNPAYCTEISPNNFDCKNGNPSKEELINAAGSSLTDDALKFIDILSDFTQVERDRKYGFEQSPTTAGASPWEVKKGGNTYNIYFPDDCHPDNPSSPINAYFNPTSINPNSDNAKDIAGVALVCSTQPKYPSLHYIFPKANHDQNDAQPLGEEYIASDYIFDDQGDTDPSNDAGVNSGVIYTVVGDDNADGTEDSTEQGISAIAFSPRTTWKLPKNDTGTASGGTLNPETMQIIDTDGTLLDVALLDKGLYNAREAMAVRVLDLDLGRLTQTTNPDGSDYWVSDARESVSGIVYAAREDAVREDTIVRPPAGTWAECDELTEVATTLGTDKVDNACEMRVSRISSGVPDPTDPPLSERKDGSFVGISPKPINFAPDPDRRPYGFRLNADIGTNKGDLSFNKKRVWGLSFVTDNAAYIKGNFNPHTTDGDDTLEEFKSPQTLFDHPSLDFYSGRTKDKINTGEFAVNGTDRWRVAEILADAVTILSDTFVDGAIDEGFIRDRKEKSSKFGNSFTSFHNQERPLKAVTSGGSMNYNNATAHADETGWVREDGLSDSSSPIRVGRNGESETSSGTVFDELNGDFLRRKDILENMIRQQMMRVAEVSGQPKRVNATMISGITPSRHLQGYGGLHNFPRFLEVWDTKSGSKNVSTKLFIQGAFLQLNFSTASTGPFDADAWDPSDNGVSGSIINYYKPPERKWGYDVALQYAPAGPIAQRFVTVEKPRSEHYREIPIDDPYVKSLRCAKLPDGATQVFADENCS